MRAECENCGGGRDMPYFGSTDRFKWQCPLCGTKYIHEAEVIKETTKKTTKDKVEVEEAVEVYTPTDDFFNTNDEGTVVEQ